jgi:hypothetical protein
MADALTLDDSDIPRRSGKYDTDVIPERSMGARIQAEINRKKQKNKSWRKQYDFTGMHTCD